LEYNSFAVVLTRQWLKPLDSSFVPYLLRVGSGNRAFIAPVEKFNLTDGNFMKKLAHILALTVVSNWVHTGPALAVTTAPVEKVAEAKTGVRKPTGDVNKFWDNIDWNDLSADEQKLWGVLSDGSSWDKLSKEERAAATSLGFDRKSWNSVPATSK
jgi:hypothetical protein